MPLLVAVRSGARDSMPGMMDTILNLGLNDQTSSPSPATGNERFAWDCYRRFIQMYGDVVMGVQKRAARGSRAVRDRDPRPSSTSFITPTSRTRS
jgi:phosphoenolpyruvate synthase/pyruvate phosphate dikinase